MLNDIAEMIYYYIIEAELFFLRYYKVDPFQIMKGMSILDLQSYIKHIEHKEKKDKNKYKNKELMTALKHICDLLNIIFYKK